MERFDLVSRNTEEILTDEDLKKLLQSEIQLNHYIGFEISGQIHIGTGIMSMKKVRDFAAAGIKPHIYLADWHAWINDKLGGDREKIKEIGVGYFKEGLIASYKAVGGNPDDLTFILGTDLYHDKADTFWATMIEVSKNTTLSRIQRSINILGRGEGENVDFAKLLYPPMQVADIFAMQIHIAHSGTDQRKAHVVARDVAEHLTISPLLDAEGKKIKPVGIHHHLILGLQKPSVWPIPKDQLREIWTSQKMSKSVPGSAVFITDSPEEIREKIMKAFAPPKEINFNPIIDWTEHLLLDEPGKTLTIERLEKFGGKVIYSAISDLKSDYSNENLHPQDLKSAVADAIINLLAPVREHFEDPKKKKLLRTAQELHVTR